MPNLTANINWKRVKLSTSCSLNISAPAKNRCREDLSCSWIAGGSAQNLTSRSLATARKSTGHTAGTITLMLKSETSTH